MRLARQQRLRQHSRKRGGYHPAPDRLRVRTVQVQAPHTLEVDRAGEGEFRPPSLLGLHHGRYGFEVVSYGCWCKNGVLVPPASPARSGLFGVRWCVLGRSSDEKAWDRYGDPRYCACRFSARAPGKTNSPRWKRHVASGLVRKMQLFGRARPVRCAAGRFIDSLTFPTFENLYRPLATSRNPC